MKIVARPVEMVVLFQGKEPPKPCRFRYEEEGSGERRTMKVDYIYETEKLRIAGADTYVYRCQSQTGDVMKVYELRYYVEEGRWELYKI